MQDFRRLVVWQKAHTLSLRVDEVAQRIRKHKPSLATQMERAAESVPANIAEGSAASTDAEFGRFVTIGIRSVTELENHIEKAHGSRLISQAEYDELIAAAIEVRRMLIGLRKRLRSDNKK
jgi:four helix bundle protein